MKHSEEYRLARNAALLGAPLPVWIAVAHSSGLDVGARSRYVLSADDTFYGPLSMYLDRFGGKPLLRVGAQGVTMKELREALIAGRRRVTTVGACRPVSNRGLMEWSAL